MKIIYCINGTYNSGGMERVLMNKTNYLADVLNYEVLIITTEQKGRKNFFTFSPKIRFIDLEINYDDDINQNLLWRILIKNKKKKKHKRLLTDILNQEKANICVSMFDRDADFLYQIKDGSKKILEFHFSRYLKVIEAKSKLMKIIQKIRTYNWKRFASKYDAFVVLTEEDKLAWGKMQNIHVINNPLNTIPKESSNLLKKRVISLGRLTYQKGFDLLIKAWEKVHASCPEWKLYIFGNGPEKESLLKQCSNLGLNDCISINKATSKPEFELLNSSLYIMSSRYEGLPMVLIEALSYGVPIVSFQCPCGPKDIIQNDFGSLIKSNDTEKLADSIIGWIQDENKRIIAGKNAKIAAQKFRIDIIMNKWIKLFNSLN